MLMTASPRTIELVLDVLQRYVDPRTLLRIADDLLDIPGNKSFRDTVEALRHSARARQSDGPEVVPLQHRARS
jgi:hypothetical protein